MSDSSLWVLSKVLDFWEIIILKSADSIFEPENHRSFLRHRASWLNIDGCSQYIAVIVLLTPYAVCEAACHWHHGFPNHEFLLDWMIRTRRKTLLLVWNLTIDLSGKGGPSRRITCKYHTSIALRYIETRKPLHHDKVAVTQRDRSQSSVSNLPVLLWLFQ